jgi:hypothetical protein
MKTAKLFVCPPAYDPDDLDVVGASAAAARRCARAVDKAAAAVDRAAARLDNAIRRQNRAEVVRMQAWSWYCDRRAADYNDGFTEEEGQRVRSCALSASRLVGCLRSPSPHDPRRVAEAIAQLWRVVVGYKE